VDITLNSYLADPPLHIVVLYRLRLQLWQIVATWELIFRSVILTEMVLSPKTITLTLTNSFRILLRYRLQLPEQQHRQVVATRNSPLRSVVLINVVLLPRSINPTLMNFTRIFYLYGHNHHSDTHELLSHSAALLPVVARLTTPTSCRYQVPTAQECRSDRRGVIPQKHHLDTHEHHLHFLFI